MAETTVETEQKEIFRKMDIAIFDFNNDNVKPASELFLPQKDYNQLIRSRGIERTYLGVKISSHPLETIEEIIVV